MFSCTKQFNQTIGEWDVSNVHTMKRMFSCAKQFNQPIGDWDVSNVYNGKNVFLCRTIQPASR